MKTLYEITNPIATAIGIVAVMLLTVQNVDAQLRTWQYKEKTSGTLPTVAFLGNELDTKRLYFVEIGCLDELSTDYGVFEWLLLVSFGYVGKLPEQYNETILVWFDEDPVMEYPVSHADKGENDVLFFSGGIIPIIKDMTEHDRMRVQVHTGQNERLIMDINLRGFSNEMAKMPKDCQFSFTANTEENLLLEPNFGKRLRLRM